MENTIRSGRSAVSTETFEASRALLWLAVAMLAIATATILGALAFEHVGGYLPCALCLMQRTPYYFGVPLAMLAVAAAWRRAPRAVLAILFGAFAALMLYSGGLAAYHSGVEWGFWEGPAACAGSSEPASVEDLFTQLETTHAPSCTEATWRLLGLSFAGWNVLVSALLTALGLYGALLAWRGKLAAQ
jgi:disulfide bond formation protein DsbB